MLFWQNHSILLYYCPQAGPYWLAFANGYTPLALMCFVLPECLGLSWLYGSRRLLNDIRAMIGDRWADSGLLWYFRVSWAIALPAILIVSTGATFVGQGRGRRRGRFTSVEYK